MSRDRGGASLQVAAEPHRLDPAIWRIASVAVIGSFMAQLDATVVNVSLSSLASSLHSTVAALHWVTSGYLLALALTLPLSGWLVDRIGARTLYLWCFALFTAASALCGLAGSANSLIGFRVLQGMSGGLLAPLAQLVIARAAGGRLAQVMSLTALPILLAPLLGPVVAGTILRFLSWRWLFFINLPVGAVGLVLAATVLPRDEPQDTRRSLDLAGLALLSPGLVLFLYGCDHAGDRFGALALAASAVLLAAFVRMAASKGDAALIDLRLIRQKMFSTAMVVLFLANGVSFSGQMLIPIFLIRDCGLSPTEAGWLMAPLGLGSMCTFALMGRLTRRLGLRRVAICGALLSLGGTLPLVALSAHGASIAVLVAALFIRGAGLSAIGVPTIASGYESVRRQDLPMATTAMNLVQRLGGPTLTTLCAAVLGWRLKAAAPGAVDGSGPFGDALTVSFALLCLLQALLLVATLRRPHGRSSPGGSSPAAGSTMIGR